MVAMARRGCRWHGFTSSWLAGKPWRCYKNMMLTVLFAIDNSDEYHWVFDT
jgi:hypothetical protein